MAADRSCPDSVRTSDDSSEAIIRENFVQGGKADWFVFCFFGPVLSMEWDKSCQLIQGFAIEIFSFSRSLKCIQCSRYVPLAHGLLCKSSNPAGFLLSTIEFDLDKRGRAKNAAPLSIIARPTCWQPVLVGIQIEVSWATQDAQNLSELIWVVLEGLRDDMINLHGFQVDETAIEIAALAVNGENCVSLRRCELVLRHRGFRASELQVRLHRRITSARIA